MSFGVIILITALILNCAVVLMCQVDSAYVVLCQEKVQVKCVLFAFAGMN